jgi:hypothetical protein
MQAGLISLHFGPLSGRFYCYPAHVALQDSAVVANLMGGAAADRFGPAPTIAGLTIGSAVVVAVLTVLQAQPVAAASGLYAGSAMAARSAIAPAFSRSDRGPPRCSS